MRQHVSNGTWAWNHERWLIGDATESRGRGGEHSTRMRGMVMSTITGQVYFSPSRARPQWFRE